MEISFTKLRVYLECPWKYKLLFLESKKIPPSPASSLGLSLHRALEDFHRLGAGGLEALLDCYHRGWIGSGFQDVEMEKRWQTKGRRMLERYFEGEKERRTKIVGVEKEFAYLLGRHTARGMIDRIDLHPDGRYEIIDYKTGLDLKPGSCPPGVEPGRAAVRGAVRECVGAAPGLQFQYYALGAREGLGLPPSRLTTYYLAAGRSESAHYDASREAELKELIVRTADLIEADSFSPDTRFCPRCDFRQSCAFSVAKA